ncbi:MAG: class I SAM-dependent methyltransferase [Spirochaetales bacterium]|nr:class I SAM-dependent methyltransferase [Spirochaetales bacterium]
MNLIKQYSNKEVPFRFNGVNLSFFLSQRLFSSYTIDAGTKLLLKTAAKGIDFSGIKTAADIGCGVGVIGLSLKKKYPDIDILLQDRDALAIAFSKANESLNSMEGILYSNNLALRDLEIRSLDLILSNIPAKAGTPVLEDFVAGSLKYLSVRGICAVVVVSTLKDTIQNAIRKSKADIIYREETREYSVFHYRGNVNSKKQNDTGSDEDLKECYIRNRADFQINKLKYTLKTVYNLPGFDTVPDHIETAAQVLDKQPVSGRTLFWNPGQGHLPVICHLLNPGKITETVLASRDILQLEISRENMKGNSLPDPTSIKPLCCPEELTEETSAVIYDSIMVFLNEADDSIPETFIPVTKSGSILIVSGKSSHLSGVSKNHRGWIQLNSRKYRGFRVIAFKRSR